VTSLTPSSASSPQRFIQIDEDGYFRMEQLRVADAEAGYDWLSRLKIDAHRRPTIEMNGDLVLVEAFDEPYVALDIQKGSANKWRITMPYGYSESFDLNTLSVDEWDRFHGRTERGIPFVLSRSAQNRFFNLVEEFEDDSFVADGQRYETQAWLGANSAMSQAEYWSKIYREEQPRWDLGGPTPALDAIVPRLKLLPMRVLIAGCGSGHDAAWFAEHGHIVTAVDFSGEAIARARKLYGHLPNLQFREADAFALPPEMNGSFDLVFEHTCYCAISPDRRNDLIRTYRRLLTDQGHLLGIFFIIDKPDGPPFGGSEWEIRARLQKNFRLLYWMRLRETVERRTGQELLVYAQKIPALG
jgi:SAM-dependent methyltransferase